MNFHIRQEMKPIDIVSNSEDVLVLKIEMHLVFMAISQVFLFLYTMLNFNLTSAIVITGMDTDPP